MHLQQGRQSMRGSYKQLILVACLCLLLAACNSSGDASSAQTAGNSDGGDTAPLADDSVISAVDNTEIDGGSAALESIEAQSGGDTAGTVTDGVGTTGGGSEIVGATAVPAIQGEWTTGCLESGAVFTQRTISVIGARMLTERAAYSDQECSVPESIGIGINGSTMQRNATTVPTGATRTVPLGEAIEINFYYEESTVENKPLTTTGFLGRDDYLKKIEYDIVLVKDQELYFGDTSIAGYAGDSAQSRPISIDSLSVYSRVP